MEYSFDKEKMGGWIDSLSLFKWLYSLEPARVKFLFWFGIKRTLKSQEEGSNEYLPLKNDGIAGYFEVGQGRSTYREIRAKGQPLAYCDFGLLAENVNVEGKFTL